MPVHDSTTLHLPCVDVQMACTHEAQQADRLRMDKRSAVPSARLIQFLNEPSNSDSVVLFLRALAAYHMQTHQQDFGLLNMQFDEEERSVVTTHVQQAMFCDTTCSLLLLAAVRIPDARPARVSLGFHAHDAKLASHFTVRSPICCILTALLLCCVHMKHISRCICDI